MTESREWSDKNKIMFNFQEFTRRAPIIRSECILYMNSGITIGQSFCVLCASKPDMKLVSYCRFELAILVISS